MASLTHVCMWSDKGWKRITAEEAAHLHPGGTVSAHSGLFMCELCGQYVLLTDGDIQIRHFRHSSHEKSKDCPERTFGAGVTYGYAQGEHELPIRITDITNHSFELEIGFIPVPLIYLTSKLQVKIQPNSDTLQAFTYLRERFIPSGITYLSIGHSPGERYSIEVTGTDDRIRQFWPKTVQGINPLGTVFDAATGKKLVYDADVAVGKKYYLLRRGQLNGTYASHVSCREISSQSISFMTWRVYEVTANDYDEASARFFLDYHCRLTEQAISIQPVWPVYVENPYVIKHNQASILMHLTGNAPTTQVFPAAPVSRYLYGNCSVMKIDCNSRQQLISAGRTKALQYTYFWREPLSQVTEKPIAAVTDLHDTAVQSGENNRLPNRKILRVTIPYDGILAIKQDRFLIEKRKLQADTPIEIDNISWGIEIEISIGLDVIWKACFRRKEITDNTINEGAILRRLESYTGPQIPIPHTAGSLAAKLSDYLLVRQWLYKCIRAGRMNEHAYRDLLLWIRSATVDEKSNEGGSI